MRINLESLEFRNFLIKMFFIIICTIYTFFKITNSKRLENKKIVVFMIIYSIILSIFVSLLKYKVHYFMSIICLILLLSAACSKINKNNFGYTILVIVISLSFNYILYFIAIILDYGVNKIFVIKDNFINLILIMGIYIVLLCKATKIKKFKNGISFISKNAQDDYFDIIILNIGIEILLLVIILPYITLYIARNLIIGLIIFSAIIVITIQRSFQLYYKHKLLVKELEDTKSELANEKEHVTALEQENLEISEKNHSLAHKQRSLEHKVDKLMLKTEAAEEIDVKNKLDNISKELYTKVATIELTKTGVEEVDDMLDCMQADCEKANIDFNLQVAGNIYYMTNNLVSRDELSTLIADHVKDAIIAINYSDNINRSILVRLGEIEDCYGLYIYDSGIEFEKETLENLGKKPYTTHKEDGGTGMGFMNTFKTLRKHNASLIINEIGKPCKDNFTKIIKIKFDGKNEFNVISYKENIEIKN